MPAVQGVELAFMPVWFPSFSPRQNNLWVTGTFEWRPEPRLAQPANAMLDGAASAVCVRSQLPFEPSLPSPLNATPLAVRRQYIN